MRRIVCLLVFLGMLLPLVITPQSVGAFSGAGSGTDGNPFVITNVSQLQEMNDNLTAYYELASDIDASATSGWNPTTDRGEWAASTYYAVNDYVLVSTYSPARTYLCKTAHTSGSSFSSTNWDRIWVDIPAYLGFIPIAIGFAEAFQGSLDGNGYSISNLYINRPLDYAGLFKKIGPATITNLKMVGPNITGLDFVGALVGTDRSWTGSTISDVHITGAVIAGDAWVGGFAGELYESTVSRCSVQGTVNAAPIVFGQYSVGGFTGYNHAIIDKCWADVDVATTDPSCEEVGGFVGLNTNNITNSYARGSVTSNDKVGGFVGYHRTGATIEHCYSTGLVTGNTNVGGFCGQNDATITDCFWDTETSGQATSAGGTGRETIYMTDICIYEAADWCIAEACIPALNRNDGYPIHGWVLDSGYDWLIHAVEREGDTIHDADWEGSLIFSPGMDCPDCPPVSGGTPTEPANWFVGTSTDHLPLQESFIRASDSLGWTMANTYMVFFLIAAIVLGVAIFAATGSILFGALAFGSGVAISSGTGVVPMWVGVVGGLVCVMSIVVARST